MQPTRAMVFALAFLLLCGCEKPKEPADAEIASVEELRKKALICGPLCTVGRIMDKRFTVFFSSSWEKEWREKLAEVSGHVVVTHDVDFTTQFIMKMSILFQDSSYNAALHSRLIKRLDSITRKDYELWWTAVVENAHDSMGRLNPWSFLATLTAINELYDEADRYDSRRADRYLKRLRSINIGIVMTWARKLSVASYDYPDMGLSLVLVDAFFVNDQFDWDTPAWAALMRSE